MNGARNVIGAPERLRFGVGSGVVSEESAVLIHDHARPLKQHAHFGDQVVILGVEARRGDLHAGIDDEKWMSRFPGFWANHVERCGKNKVLHLAVAAACKIKS